EPPMSIWSRIGDFLKTVSTDALSSVIETVRTVFAGDPELRRRVAFSIAMIALSAKMARADGIVTQNEFRAFQEIFIVPPEETRNVARLFDLAKQDIAGFEIYAEQLAGLCGSGRRNSELLDDIFEALYHIAQADGHVHAREVAFLERVAEIFSISDEHFQTILSRHAVLGEADPWLILGLDRGTSFEEVRK